MICSKNYIYHTFPINNLCHQKQLNWVWKRHHVEVNYARKGRVLPSSDLLMWTEGSKKPPLLLSSDNCRETSINGE